MRKYCIISLFLASVMLLYSCSTGGGRATIFNDDGRIADIRLEQLLEILVSKDEDALKKMFSKQALKEAINFDENMDYLFELFQGNIVSWERTSIAGGTKSESGKKAVQVRSWYKVTTDKDEYLFLVVDYTQDTINPDNHGLYALEVVRTEDAEEQITGYWQDLKAGIFKP